MRRSLVLSLLLIGCGPTARYYGNGNPGGGDSVDMSNGGNNNNGNGSPDLAGTGGNNNGGNGQQGCGEFQNCYTVWAHADHVLYHLDLANKGLVRVGPFNAPMVPYTNANGTTTMEEDVITDLAVSGDNTIYVVSKTNLYTASPTDGHVTMIGSIGTCGSDNVALTFVPDGSLYVGDYNGNFCQIDLSANPPAVKSIGMLSGGLALSGDIVAVDDGTVYGTAYLLSDLKANGGTGGGTIDNNYLIKLDPKTATATIIGQTGYPKLFGIAFDNGVVYGFVHSVYDPSTHKSSANGQVISIDPKTGVGTAYNTFNDPMTNMPIGFSGAGVNYMVPPPPVM